MSSFFHIEFPQAKNDYSCGLCHSIISSGDVYRKETVFDGEDFWVLKDCMECDSLLKILPESFFDLNDSLNTETVLEWAEEEKDNIPEAKIFYDKFKG